MIIYLDESGNLGFDFVNKKTLSKICYNPSGL